MDENARNIGKLSHEVSLLMKFPQTKSEVISINNYFYKFYYTDIEHRDRRQQEEEFDIVKSNLYDNILPGYSRRDDAILK